MIRSRGCIIDAFAGCGRLLTQLGKGSDNDVLQGCGLLKRPGTALFLVIGVNDKETIDKKEKGNRNNGNR
jgi:hypothetical protein